MFAGTARAPITAVLILFEMTRDYALILPLMTAVVSAALVSQLLSTGTVYTVKLARRGVHIEEETLPANVMQTLRVADAMSPVWATVSPNSDLTETARAMGDGAEAAVLVTDDAGQLIGILTNTDLNEAIALDTEQTAGDICTRDVQTIFPDVSLHHALSTFAGRSLHVLPVMFREQPEVACGVLRRSDITNAYAAAIERRDSKRRLDRLSPVTSDHVRYLELRVAPESVLNHHYLNEVRITEDAVIVAIRRDGVTLIPRGHTRLEEGDRVTVISAASAVEDVRGIFSGASVPMPDGSPEAARSSRQA